MNSHQFTRRSFIGTALTTGAAAALLPAHAREAASSRLANPSSTFIDVLRVPDSVACFAGLEHAIPLSRTGSRWHGGRQVEVVTQAGEDKLLIQLSSPNAAVTHIHLRWKAQVTPSLLVLGDAWERSYGDLAWRNLTPERVLPWYFVTADATDETAVCHAYGVMTSPRAFCFWQIDQEGVSLWLNVQNGGIGVDLGQRQLDCATVVSHAGRAGEGPFEAVRAFCRKSCARATLPVGPVYGANDWYYAYGHNTAEQILRDTDLIASLAGSAAARPFSVIDMGWEMGGSAFPDMSALAQRIKKRNVRPGIWVRPLKAAPNTTANLLLPASRFATAADDLENAAYDPTLPEAQQIVTERIQQLVGWGYELVKHDFSTYDLLGQWGFEMGASPTRKGWTFHDRSKTNAEIVSELYELIRKAAGAQTILLGCNTVGHLAQGIFEAQRTGDDTSGKTWERTRRMGVNTLAFRLPQHGVYFAQDADCVGITPDVPWALNRQWLDVLARSGTALFISPEPTSIGAEQRRAIAEAFARVAEQQTAAHALDWFDSTTPQAWGTSTAGVERYDWCDPEGAYPFAV